jgi:hypothetical protein
MTTYRLLNKGEKLMQGDIGGHLIDMETKAFGGSKVSDYTADTFGFPIYRPITTEWIKISEREPVEFPVALAKLRDNGTTGANSADSGAEFSILAKTGCYTHWRPLDLPEEKEEWEVAWEKRYPEGSSEWSSIYIMDVAKATFKAGFLAAKEGK